MLDFKELDVDGVRFEQFIRELCMRSNLEVHWTGVGADGGRDLVAIERATGALGLFERKWLVSCKHLAHSEKSAGVEATHGLVDACEAVGATGFLLACSTQPTSGTVKRLEEIAAQGKIATLFWDAVELDRRTQHPSTFALRATFFPVSAAVDPWRIYNTETPSRQMPGDRSIFTSVSRSSAGQSLVATSIRWLVA